ncbi:hypothetical protein [Roseisalinus antarcticus]|uniref:Uncharacterized protein n=1 Tax=Roseisalinus antarcticus TaxID=254357 RepID=A0A1Y5RZG1_9RHOB|nr:hypothetical protein [Roseisalinus antarcticus]SLN28053.1 hypothetical protein ROA7023_00930 [Roseisalinus antarcticus]
MIRPLCTLVLAAAVCAGCGPQRPEGAVALDLSGAQQAFFASNPAASGVRIIAEGKGRYDVARDGTALYRPSGSTSGLTTSTDAVSVSGNTLCVPPSGTWTGVCIDVFDTGTGYFCEGTFGNNASWAVPCRFEPV